jgi:hypothetical protein
MGSGMVVGEVDIGKVIQPSFRTQPHIDSSRAQASLGLALTEICRVDVSFMFGLAIRRRCAMKTEALDVTYEAWNSQWQ